jgi:hypothetical protein
MPSRSHEHDPRRGGADFGAADHQREVILPDMIAARLQAVRHRHLQAGLVTTLALADAVLQIVAHGEPPDPETAL